MEKKIAAIEKYYGSEDEWAFPFHPYTVGNGRRLAAFEVGWSAGNCSIMTIRQASGYKYDFDLNRFLTLNVLI